MNPRIPLIVIIVILVGVFGYELYTKKPHDPNCKDCKPPVTAPLPEQKEIAPPPQPIEEEKPAPVNGKTYTYAEGLALSKQTKIPMLVVFGAEWCTWCKKLEGTLKDSSVATVTGKYINVHVDTDKEKDVARKYRVSGIPVYMLVDENERPLKEGSGYKSVPDFLQWLKLPAVKEEDDQ